jgi:subtilisin family serine protease
MRKIFAVATTITLCVLTTFPPSALSQGAKPTQAPQAKLRRSARPIHGSYIVVLKESVAGPRGARSKAPVLASDLAVAYGGQLNAVFQYALQGFSASLSEAAAIALSEHPQVAYVEEDSEIHAMSFQSNTPWGLDRIDQRNLPLDTVYSIPNFGEGAPAAVNVYVLDTGIRVSHTEFGGRASVAFDAFGGNGLDCNGHGTHVAGIIGAARYGVAPNVNLRSVRVLDCAGRGSETSIIAGVDWVTANHQPGQPAVANMSLGATTPSPTALDTAVNNSILDGITYVIAAGNGDANGNGQDACLVSPARVTNAITVGSTNDADSKASSSNFGTCLDIFAPGVDITSTWHTSDTATMMLSGTSMAAPHVAGAAALYLQKAPAATPETVRNALVNKVTRNVLFNIGTGSPNRLLYSIVTPNDTDPGGTLSGNTGTLSATGDVDYWTVPNTGYGGATFLRATMRGPTTADFDLFLQRWTGTQWVSMSASTGTNSYEVIATGILNGFSYRWAVYSYRGSGTYKIAMSSSP